MVYQHGYRRDQFYVIALLSSHSKTTFPLFAAALSVPPGKPGEVDFPGGLVSIIHFLPMIFNPPRLRRCGRSSQKIRPL